MGPREVLFIYLSFLASHIDFVIGNEREVLLFRKRPEDIENP